ncbi:GSCOCG00011471001-RA-CDS [Cotesia congregata]|uniref:Similar to Ctcfl: Transcriptional repressor CTCFL (Mus musculus) n=1 Tax=Cotesia congregata TaxID=51543 RepID=A0A8J2HCX9_COTCN|nr:GSCOCG00011471001-RA-CDS [Cotesia congregata]CAG5090219.1 Similar to Ctcfl: Transcriptional repressor CTCFL (Mus musculus) [Cotesia congregata]
MYPSEIIVISDDDDESVVEMIQNTSACDSKCNSSKTNTSIVTPVITSGFKNVKNELNELVDDDRFGNNDDENYNFLMQELSDLINSYKSNSVNQDSLIVPEISDENVDESTQNNIMGKEKHIQIVSVESLNHRINQWMDTSMEEEFVPPVDYQEQKVFEGGFNNVVANNHQDELLELNYDNSESLLQSQNDPWMKTPMNKLELKVLNKYLPMVQLTKISLSKNSINLKNFIKEELQIDANVNGPDLKPLIHQNMVNVKQEVGSELNSVNDVNQGLFICKTCIITFNSRDSFEEHIEYYHPGNKIYKCDDCHYATDTHMSMQTHRWTHIKERPFRCRLCNYGSKLQQHLKMHIRRIHTNERPFVCPHVPCMFAGAYSQDLKNHIKNKHSKNDKTVSLDSLRNNRSRSHTHLESDSSSVNLKDMKTKINSINPTEQMYPCTHCTFSTPCTNELKVHLSKHETESSENFKCDACGKRFINKDQHIRNYHTLFPSNKEIKCSFCEETFTNNYNMKVHLKTHVNKDLKKCGICLYITSSKKKFRIHMSDHRKNKLFTCNNCSKSFRSKNLCSEHRINFHYLINNF